MLVPEVLPLFLNILKKTQDLKSKLLLNSVETHGAAKCFILSEDCRVEHRTTTVSIKTNDATRVSLNASCETDVGLQWAAVLGVVGNNDPLHSCH